MPRGHHRGGTRSRPSADYSDVRSDHRGARFPGSHVCERPPWTWTRQPPTEGLRQTMDASEPLITVLTVTRRAEHLSRCIHSVRDQNYRGSVRHLLVVDDKEDCCEIARREGVPDENVVFQGRGPGDADGPSRLAELRNLAVKVAGDTWMAFLDDDNRWEADHLRSLWKSISDNGAGLAHSQRKIYEADGSPFLRAEFPWGRDELTRRAIYAYCIVAGIM